MKKCLFHILFLSFFIPVVNASDKDSTVYYPVPDSIKAISFIAEINVLEINTTKEVFTGIRADRIKLVLESDKDGKEVVFEFPASAQKMAKGIDVIDDEKGELEWEEYSHFGMITRLQAGAAGLPFLPMNQTGATDLEKSNPQIKRIPDPYGGKDVIVVPDGRRLYIEIGRAHV